MNDRQTELKEHSAHIFEMGCMEQRVYLKNDADAVIEAKDAEIAKLKESQRWRKFSEEKPKEWATVVVKFSDGFYDLAVYLSNGQGWDIGDGLYHKSEEVTRWMPMPPEPKEELESNERRLKRALWLARALRAEARKNYWYARSVHEGDNALISIDGSAVKYIGCIKRTIYDWLKTWSEVESKCRAMAEKFK